VVSVVTVTATELAQTMKIVCTYRLFVRIVICIFVDIEPMYHKNLALCGHSSMFNKTQLN
jgi:hypothetical protein